MKSILQASANVTNSDAAGAKAAGLRAVLVRTGKFREETLAGETRPDAVVDSIADVPALLEEAG